MAENGTAGTVRKGILRHVEVPVTKKFIRRVYSGDDYQTKEVRKGPTPSNIRRPTLPPQKESHNNLGKPMLNTALKLQRKISDLRKPKISQRYNSLDQTKITVLEEINKEMEAIAREKVTQQMNFPQQKKVFKNLAPTNVNDSLLVDSHIKPADYRTNKKLGAEPNLADYVDRVKPIRMHIPLEYPEEVIQPPEYDIGLQELSTFLDLANID